MTTNTTLYFLHTPKCNSSMTYRGSWYSCTQFDKYSWPVKSNPPSVLTAFILADYLAYNSDHQQLCPCILWGGRFTVSFNVLKLISSSTIKSRVVSAPLPYFSAYIFQCHNLCDGRSFLSYNNQQLSLTCHKIY